MVNPEDDPLVGKTIDGCKIVRRLGAGDRSLVYEARTSDRLALKILNPALTDAADTVERFFREAQAVAQANHPSIVAIQNVGQEGEVYFLRMELVDGETAEAIVEREGPLPWQAAATLGFEVAEALAHVHQKGMVHRDIGPQHIMLCGEDRGDLKLIGFGLAKHVHSSAKVSVTGEILGSPFWMSPEQAGGKPTDARADIYSLGVTLYYLVTGVRPFNGKNTQEVLLKHFFYAPESPRIYQEDLPDAFCEVIQRCLQKKKLERYQSAGDLARDLRAVVGLGS